VASIERTAYPRFKRYYTLAQLQKTYTPTSTEIAYSLLENHPVQQRSPYNDLKKLPQKSTRNHLNDLLVHLTWLESLGDIAPDLEKINPSKIQHWAAEAKSLDASEIKKITQPKRVTLLLCLIYVVPFSV
jgi:hypothetical protein